MYIYIHTYIYIYIYIYIYTYIHIYTHIACTYTCTYANEYKCTYTHTRTRTCTRAHTSKHDRTHTFTYKYLHIYVYMRAHIAGEGVITGKSGSDGWVKVVWDKDGSRNSYRWGAESSYDLEIIGADLGTNEVCMYDLYMHIHIPDVKLHIHAINITWCECTRARFKCTRKMPYECHTCAHTHRPSN